MEAIKLLEKYLANFLESEKTNEDKLTMIYDFFIVSKFKKCIYMQYNLKVVSNKSSNIVNKL